MTYMAKLKDRCRNPSIVIRLGLALKGAHNKLEEILELLPPSDLVHLPGESLRWLAILSRIQILHDDVEEMIWDLWAEFGELSLAYNVPYALLVCRTYNCIKRSTQSKADCRRCGSFSGVNIY